MFISCCDQTSMSVLPKMYSINITVSLRQHVATLVEALNVTVILALSRSRTSVKVSIAAILFYVFYAMSTISMKVSIYQDQWSVLLKGQ